MDALEIVRTAAAVVASGGVVVAARAYRHTREQARTGFEDSLAREFREIISALPPEAFRPDSATALEPDERKGMFRYFDLSNEQLRLVDERRVRRDTGRTWEDGIRELMAYPTFRESWTVFCEGRDEDFFSYLWPLVQRDGPNRADGSDGPGHKQDAP